MSMDVRMTGGAAGDRAETAPAKTYETHKQTELTWRHKVKLSEVKTHAANGEVAFKEQSGEKGP